MRRKPQLVIAALAAAAAIAVLVQAAPAASSAKTIIIGAAVDQSGVMSPFDDPALAAAGIEIKAINDRGGVLGHKLRIISCNTQNSKPDVAKACVSNLVSRGASIGWVTGDVDFATPAVTEFLKKRMLVISPYLGTDQLGPKRFGAAGRLAFSFGNVAQDEGAAMAEYAYNVKHWKSAVTVSDNLLVYFKNVVQAFTVRFKQLGGDVVEAESFTNGDKTIGNVVSRVAQHKADVIVTATAFGDWPTFFAGLRSLGNNTPIFNSKAGDGTYWYPKGTPVSNYYFTTESSVFGDDPSPQVQALISAMKAAKKAPTSGTFVTGAGAIDGLAQAIKRAKGSTQGAALAAVLEKFRAVPTIAGAASFTSKLHTVFGRQYRVIEVENSKPQFIARVRASSPANIG